MSELGTNENGIDYNVHELALVNHLLNFMKP